MGSILDACAERERETHENKSNDVIPKNKLAIIGFTGKAKSGKDTAAEVFRELAGCDNCEVMSFAQPLKEIAMIFGFTREQCYNQDLKEVVDEFWGITPRKFLQLTGTEMFRNHFREDCWTKLFERRIINLKKEITGPKCVLVTDVRFPNEVDCIRRLGGSIFKIQRPSLSTSSNMYRHPSEIYIDELKADLIITNDYDNLDDYKLHCKEIFMEWVNKK